MLPSVKRRRRHCPDHNQVHNWGYQWEEDLENKDIWQRYESQGSKSRPEQSVVVLPCRLQGPVHPAESLPDKGAHGVRRLSQPDRFILIGDRIAEFPDRHCKVRVFGERQISESTSLQQKLAPPCPDCARNDGYAIQSFKCPAIQILTGDILKRLPSSQQIDSVPHFGIARHSADPRVAEMAHEFADCVSREYRVRVERDNDIRIRP